MVKKILLAAILLAGVSVMNAQTKSTAKKTTATKVSTTSAEQDGKFYMGGTLGFTWSSMKPNGGAKSSGASFKINPELGYKLSKKVSVGLQVGYSHGYAAFGGIDFNDFKSIANAVISTAADIASDNNMKLNSMRVAPYVRYNFLQAGKFGMFVEGGIGYIYVKGDGNMLILNDPKLNVIEVNIRPGISVQLAKNVDLVAKVGSLGFIHGKEKGTDVKITRFGLDVDTYNILFGLNYRF
ncbi:MAG: porin family protein [Bacteroidaceae bacterium]|nr:porin family protein [Bacteroidaceae bacterium]